MANRIGVRQLGKWPRGECVVKDVKPIIHPSVMISRKSTNRAHSTQSSIPCIPLSRRSPLYQAPLKPVTRRAYASDAEDLSKTPLYELHVRKKAKFVPFGGFSMPLYYDDLSHVESHRWTREKASIFDVSHMYDPSLALFES
jgi:Aminomethyltransferase folate-binding domain